MEIKTLEISATLTRDNEGHVSLKVNPDKQPRELASETLELSGSQLLNFTKKLSDENQRELAMARAALMPGDTDKTREVTYLEKRVTG